MSNSVIQQYSQEDLPVTLQLSSTPPETTSNAGLLLTIAGILIAATGGGFIIFGPSSFYYDISTGMTFIQYLQAYPGPIATVGFLILAGGQHMKSAHVEKQALHLESMLIHESSKHLSFKPNSLPANQSLYFLHMSDSTYEVGIREAE